MGRRKMVFNLGEIGSWISDEDIATQILTTLERQGRRNPTNLYRGVTGDKDKINLIKRIGTDRTQEGIESAAESYAKANEERLISWGDDPRKVALKQVNPRKIWAAPEEDLVMAVSYATDEITDGNPIGAVIVYDGHNLDNERSNYFHTFSGNPKEAMLALFKFTQGER